MTSPALPAVSLAAVPGRRRRTLELAQEIERRGFAGIYCPSFGDGMGLCEALALTTERIPFGTGIANIYMRHVSDYAQSASLIQELSGGRFRFGVGVSHQPVNQRAGLQAGPPLGDIRDFIDQFGSVPRVGELPPVVVAALRKRMVALAGEVGGGLIFANAARSHMPESLAVLPDRAQGEDFFIGNMIPTCISDDVEAAAAVNRRTLSGYVALPNYRNYWKEAGYVEEMEAVEKVLAAGERERVPEVLSDRWLADTTLFGSASTVLEGLEAWYEAGVRTPILVPSSAAGNQMKAFEELFDLF
ncbi:MAG: LLM class flavin-dependent oxidoreductase [Deltaproteobacteria bacterium]|nr:LLM class flavin-dependent oxidoreductase [Deltaproteobacteria bacterium]MBW2414210.1 LLM class flavin-dependent oxidoreductase [Deltaproteobacteria bacterium]